MTVGELRELLEEFDNDMEVVMKPSNSIYADGIRDVVTRELRANWGSDREVLVITSDGQEGSI